jgi:hypothetical protein
MRICMRMTIYPFMPFVSLLTWIGEATLVDLSSLRSVCTQITRAAYEYSNFELSLS